MVSNKEKKCVFFTSVCPKKPKDAHISKQIGKKFSPFLVREF